jgi:hypothetical protein
MRLGFVPLIALLGFVAIGGCARGDRSVATETTRPMVTETTPPRALAACTPMEPGRNDRFLLCWRPNAGDRGEFSFRGRGRIPIAYPSKGPAGHWSGGFLSPDGDTLLAQWTAECEVPYAFFVPARGGTPRPVTGERRIEDAPPSIAHGWTQSGEAIIEVIPECSEGTPHAQTEILLISPKDGNQRRLGVLPD